MSAGPPPPPPSGLGPPPPPPAFQRPPKKVSEPIIILNFSVFYRFIFALGEKFIE